ncbi:unnamed protein product [Adineta steineri]|uniref:Ubiquitin-like protease family profile domain-containing protein n=1 Tax=Adineta steineri TaxID=433720 RepID=A0A818PSL2_9BILA|nr:unnamed protein product [Adineta steineri]CAF3627988.1 unnamed protein product [Adineta steineri]
MDEFIHLPKTFLNELLDCLSQKLSNEDIKKEIERIMKPASQTTTDSGLEKLSHIYSFILNCFTDLQLISSTHLGATNNKYDIEIQKTLTKEILLKLYENLKCCQKSISIFQLFSYSDNDDDSWNLLNEIRKFLNKYPQYKNKFGIYGTTILYEAVKYGNIEIIKYLIEIVKCPLNLQNPKLILPNGNELLSNENTPLHAACYFQHLHIVKYLLRQENIDLNLKNSFGQTPEMIAESNKNQFILQELNQFSKKSEMFYIILNETTNLNKEHEELIENFILKNSHSIQKILSDDNNVKQSLVAISYIEQQQWIVFAIVKVSKEVFVFFDNDEFSSSSSSYSSHSYENKKSDIMKIIEEKFKDKFLITVIENGNPEENDEISNNQGFALAIHKMDRIIRFLENKTIKKQEYKEKFEETRFYDCDESDKRREIIFNFEKLFVKIGLHKTIRTKKTLEKILISLKAIIEDDKKYLLEEVLLIKLTDLLTKRNFIRVNDNEIDLKQMIINILLDLKNRGQEFNEQNIKSNLENYYNNNSNLKKIKNFYETLRQDARDSQINGCLILALDHQKELLLSIEKLIPNTKFFDEFIQLLDEHYQERQKLEIEKTKLNNKLRQRGKGKEFIDITFQISKIEKQIDYYSAKAEISKSVDIDDLIILLGKNLTDEYKFSQGTINKIIEVGKRIEKNEELALALIKIFEKISSDENHSSKEIEEVFNKLLSKISLTENNVKTIVNLRKEFLINLHRNSNLLKFLHQILIENQDPTNRTKALEIMQLLKFYSNDLEYIKQAVKLEIKSSQHDPTVVEDCLMQVQNRNKLTWNIFQNLKNYFSTDMKTIEQIIEKIVEQDLQKIPKEFIDEFQKYINKSLSFDNTKILTSIYNLLIKGKYSINFDKIQSKIGDLLSTNTDEILEMILTKFYNGDKIEPEIIDKIKDLPKENQFAQNIMNLIEKDSIDDNLSILKNSRNELTQRKQALSKIVSPPINLLESLIAYEPSLRADAFKILPNDSEIDFNIITQAIYNDKNIHIEDVSQFIDKIKNKEDFSIILPAIIHRFYNNQQSEVLELLTKISQSKRKQGEEFVKYLLNLIENTYENQIRSELITIIEKCMENNEDLKKIQIKKPKIDNDGTIKEIQSLLTDELNQLKTISLIDGNTLENLSKIIQQRNRIVTQNEIISLIDTLIDSTKQKSISDLLLQIDLTQGLDDTIMVRLYKEIISNPKLIQYPSLLAIITINLNKNRKVPDPIIKTLWEEFLILPEVKQNLIYIIMLLVTQNKQIPMNVLEKLVMIFKNQQEDVQLRIAIGKILSKQIENTSEQDKLSLAIESLKKVALQSRNNQNEDLLNKFVYSDLEKYVDDEFLNNFYVEFKSRVLNIDKKTDLQKLDAFIQQEQDQLKKFQLLNVLNIRFSNSQTLDTTIFEEFHQDEWTSEILASELIIEISQLQQEINESELKKFRDYIRLLTSQKNYVIEDLLEILIIKQNIYGFNLEKLNDIFFLLISQKSIDRNEKTKVLDILQSDSDDFYIQLQLIWLAKQLKDFSIIFTNENLKELNQYLPYKPETINLFLTQVNQSSLTIEKLIEFFKILTNSGLTFESSQTFLIDELIEKTTLKHLLKRLREKSVGSVLSKRFPFYQDYFRNRKNCNLLSSKKATSRKNAYNQAHTTEWYTAEDIAQITSEWMKEFNTSIEGKKLRTTQALGRQDNMSLSTVLNKVIDEYKQEKDTMFIIPLNIAGNHWVTVALVPDQEKHIVLYKDSLGEENQIEERKEVEQIFRIADLKNFKFKYNRSCEQSDGYNCGVFVLGNMKIMAEQLTTLENKKKFIENFENYENFVNQEKVAHLRKEIFPKMYALSLCKSFKRREIVDHHLPELKHLEELLQNKTIITTEENNQLQLSIALPQEENLLENDYKYLYVIKINDPNSLNVDFTQTSDLKTKLIQGLGITKIYEDDKTFIKILDKNLIKLTQKKTKLQPSEFKIEKLSLRNEQIEKLLGQLDVDITEFNKNILRENLGLKGENNVSPSTIKNQNEIIDIQDCELLYELHQKLTKILTCAGWILNSVVQLVPIIDSKLKLKHLVNSLDPIYEYKLKEYDENVKGKSVFQILMTTSSEKWITDIHNLAIFQTFKGSHIKDISELTREIFSGELNKQHNLSFCQDEKLILNEYKNIKIFYETKKSQICSDFGIIQEWNDGNLRQWSEKFKLNHNSISHYEIIAVIKKAVEITSGFSPKEIQLLSLIILLNSKENLGRLVQINTGEGKTTIVAMLAAFKALKGRHQVDIITSSLELAQPQSDKQKKFFILLGLTCEHNGPDSSIDIEERYKADIVYGTATQFQGDILRDEYSKLETRQGRKCDVAIVDEVDSMLIDGKNHIVRMTSSMPGMDHLEPLLAAIWIQIGEVAKLIKEHNGKWYYIDQKDVLDENGKLRSDIVEHAYCIKETKEEFIANCTEKHIRKLIRDEVYLSENLKNYPEIKIPEHLRKLIVESHLEKWISYAIYAKYRCKNGQDYIIKNEKITLVDASNTGTIQYNMSWNDGLHQFLQLKHGAKITPENLTTNFISNVTYFKRYSPRIFGLTGTLGSANARQLLNDIYEVDSVIIPPFKQKQYKELTPIISDQEDDWYRNIIQSSLNKLNNGRAVLIITKYIQQVEEINNRLIDAGYTKEKIKMYKTEEDSTKATKEVLKHGEIIIATNIAGRGTDIQANDTIENNGGLHVCVTFLPVNERVEQQNVGRTSRIGNKGTAQFILLREKSNDTFEKLKEIRDKDEEEGLNSARTQIKDVIIKDEIFKLFCKLLNEINDNKEENELKSTRIQINELMIKNEILPLISYELLNKTNDNLRQQEYNQKFISKIKRRAVEERFGIWLKMEESITSFANAQQMTKDEIEKYFEKFKTQILLDKKDKLIQNPYFHVLLGNEFLKIKDYNKAIDEFTKAIKLDDYYQVNAFYNRGYARIAQYGNDIHHEEINKAIEDFKEAKKIIEEHLEPLLNIIQQASTHSEALSEQVAHKMTLYGVQKNTIEMVIGQDITTQIKALQKEKQERKDATERRRKEIDQQLENLNKEETTQTEQINELEKEKEEQQNIMIDTEKAIDEQIKNLQVNQEAKELGIICQARKSNRSIQIEHVEIKESLPTGEDIKLYEEEIREYKSNGFRGSFRIKEIKPIDWKAVISVASIGIAQLVGGAAIAVFSLGAGTTVGMGLIYEGVCDLITAVKDGIINRDFSWVSYGIQKAISLTVSLVCAGMGAIKDAAKTLVAGVKNIGQVMTTTVKAGWKIAAKAIGTGLAKGVAKELVTQLVDYGVSKTLMPVIQDEVMKRIKRPIQKALLANPCVEKMLKLDGTNRNSYYEHLIISEAMQLLNSDKQQSALLTITVGIGSGIAKHKIEGLSTILNAVEVTRALDQLNTFVDDFKEKLNEIIDKIYKEQKIDEKESQNQAKPEGQQQQENSSQNSASNYTPETSDDDVDVEDDKKEQQVQLGRKSKSSNALCGTLATSVSAEMCNIIQKKLIIPVAQTGINYSMTELTSGLDQSLQDQIGNYQTARRIEFFQGGDKNNRIPDVFKKAMYDPAAVKEADKMIEKLRSDGEAGLPHLGPLSDAAGRQIIVLDEDGQRVYIIGEDKGDGPIEVQYHQPNKDNPSGHWTLPGGKEPADGSTEKNNCLFNVIAQQTGKKPDELRKDTVVMMENTKMNLANQVNDIKRLERYKKDALIMGGFKHHLGEERSKLDESQGAKPYGSKAAGHPNNHIQGNLSLNAIAKKAAHTNFLNEEDQNKCTKEGMDYIIGNQAFTQDPGFIKAEVTFPLRRPVPIAIFRKNKDITYDFANSATLVLHNRIDNQNQPDLHGPVHVQTVFGHPASSGNSPMYVLTITRRNPQTNQIQVTTTTHIPDEQWMAPRK